MPDFSELANYLRAQIDLDSDQLYSDEPWAWSPLQAQPAVQFTPPKPAPNFTPGFAPAAPRPAPAQPCARRGLYRRFPPTLP